MTDRYEIDFSDDPKFNTVSGLINTTFDIENVVIHRGATEGQLSQLANLINALETRIEGCCNRDTSDEVLQYIIDKLDELEALLANCNGSGGTQPSGCDGNIITVSTVFTGPLQGKATAVSSMPDHNIVGYHFLIKQDDGVYYKSSTARGGLDIGWSIGADGTMVGSATIRGPFSSTIVATDDHGCEGTTYVSLPAGPIIGP